MGLATIDPNSQKEHTEIHKISKFGVNQASLTEIQRFKNVKVSDSVRMAIHFFVNFGIFKWSNYTKLGDFVKLGLHFMTMWINSC